LPGRYAEAIERWLQYYPPEQISILDGDELKTNPVSSLSKVSDFLGLAPFPFEQYIKYNQGKKFFCKYKGDKYDCLGRGKGRSYGRMTSKEWQFLSDYYHLPNMKLYDLLISLKKKIPNWLKKEIDKIEKGKS